EPVPGGPRGGRAAPTAPLPCHTAPPASVHYTSSPARRETCLNAPVPAAAAVPAARPARLGGAGLQPAGAAAPPGAHRLGRHRRPAAAPPRPGAAAGGRRAGLRRP